MVSTQCHLSLRHSFQQLGAFAEEFSQHLQGTELYLLTLVNPLLQTQSSTSRYVSVPLVAMQQQLSVKLFQSL
jgi:hypothetical protein